MKKVFVLFLIIILCCFMCLLYSYYNVDNFKNKTPYVSVIVPVYNQEKYLKRSMDSILSQSLKNIEVICINDGSTDKSIKILREYVKKYKNVRVYSQLNKGVARARNRGLSLAQGQYVIFLDSDDDFKKNMLETMYNKAKMTNSDIVICHSNIFEDGKFINYDLSVEKKYLPSKDVFSYRDFPQYIFNFTHGQVWDKLYKKEFLDKHQLSFQPIKHHEDTAFVYMSLVLADKITTVKDTFVIYYTKNPKSLTSNRQSCYECFYKAFELLHDELVRYNLYEITKQSYINIFVETFLWNYQVKDINYLMFIRTNLPNMLSIMGIEEISPEYFYDLLQYKRFERIIKFNERINTIK